MKPRSMSLRGTRNRLGRLGAQKGGSRAKAGDGASAPPVLIAQDVLVSGAALFLTGMGLPRTTIAAKLRTAAEIIESRGRIPIEHSKDYDLFVNVSGVMHDWARGPDYTDVNGEPRALPLQGRRGLAALIRTRVPRRPISDVLRWMRYRGIASRRRDGRYVLLKRFVLVGHPDPVYLELAATIAAQYLKAAIENWGERNPGARQLDRIARVFNLPELAVPRFRDFVKRRTASWLEEMDNWLEDHDEPSRRRRRVQAGVHVFGYVAGAERGRMR
jgi:hypothetical protein